METIAIKGRKGVPIQRLIQGTFFLFMVGITAFSDTTSTLMLFYLTAVLYAGAVCYMFLAQGTIRLPLNTFLRTQLLFILWLLISALWQYSNAYYSSRLTTLVIVYVFALLTSVWVTDKETLNSAYKCILYANVINAVYRFLLNTYGNAEGVGLEGKNSTAVQMVISYAIALYMFYSTRKKRYVVFGILFAVVALLTASRKSVAGLLIVTVVMLVFNIGKKKRFSSVLLVTALLLAGYWALTNLKAFSYTYERLMQMLEHIQGGKGDYSSETRELMRQMGWRAFQKNPVQGYGVGYSYTNLTAGAGEDGTYLHNNYVEVGVSLGIVGLAFFYWPHVRILLTAAPRFFKNNEYLLIMALIVVMLILDYGMVSYFDKFNLLMLNILSIHSGLIRKGLSNGSTEERHI
jgi:O-antigen ligase